MADWKETIGSGIRGVTDRQKAALNTARRGYVASANTLERAAAYQLALSGDLASGVAEQLRLAGEAAGPRQYLESEVGLVAGEIKKSLGRVRELGGLYADGFADLVVATAGIKTADAAS